MERPTDGRRFADLIEEGKVIALNFPIAMNPGLPRALGTMLKQDFQRAVLNRISRMGPDQRPSSRPVVFLCDEYQAFATTGENEPSGDEKFFSLARQARCIPIVATQSISSLRSKMQGANLASVVTYSSVVDCVEVHCSVYGWCSTQQRVEKVVPMTPHFVGIDLAGPRRIGPGLRSGRSQMEGLPFRPRRGP